jgi:tripartite-type tricarboxylate transporter receptor subunit TctC
LAEFIESGKKNPGRIDMASCGAGTSVHRSGELLQSIIGQIGSGQLRER